MSKARNIADLGTNDVISTSASGITVTGTVSATDFSGDGSNLTGVDSLPDQTGNTGKYLTTDGTDASWVTVDALPDQTDNSGKYLTTDGTDASWADVSGGYVEGDSIRAATGSVSNVGLGFTGVNDYGFYKDGSILCTAVGGGPAMWISPLAKYGFGTPSQVEASGTQNGISFSPLSNPQSKWSNNLGYFLQFFDGSSQSDIGYIVNNFGTLQFTAVSDYRLKENIVPLTDAVTRLKQIPVHRFSFINRGDTVVDGFLAHEVQEVVPEAVCGIKDGTKVDEEGNTVPEYQGIDQSKLVPLLVAAVKELEARLAVLEGS